MYIKKVMKSGDEADLILSDGNHECLVFCHPCSLNEGDEFDGMIHVFDTDDIVKSDEETIYIEYKPSVSHYNHWIVAEVENVSKGKLKVGDFHFQVFRLPGDIKEGERVEFNAYRLDLH